MQGIDSVHRSRLRIGRDLWLVGAVAAVFAGAVTAQSTSDKTPRDKAAARRPDADRSTKKDATAPDMRAEIEAVIEAHNRIRAESNLPALAVSGRLQRAAERHAKDMAARDEMTHKGSDGSSAIARIKATGYPYRRAGENIAAGYLTTQRLMTGWMNSPHHKRNILGSYSQIGVACATSESGKRYWCVTFGLPIRR